MADIVSQDKRSEIMSAIKNKNTKPEILVRKALHHKGFRFRLHCKNLAGKPDIVLSRYKTVILVNGCFWHGHNCHLFKWPKSNIEFWKEKINGTKGRDKKNIQALESIGWQVITIWECSLRGQTDEYINNFINDIAKQIKTNIKT